MPPPYIAANFLPDTDSIQRRLEAHSQNLKVRLYLDLLSTLEGLSTGGREPYVEALAELRRIGPLLGIDITDV